MDYLAIFHEAKNAAVAATSAKFAEIGDFGACGFAWVQIPEPMHAAALVSAGLAKKGDADAFRHGAIIYDPGQSPVQSLNVMDAGADAFAAVMARHGIKARAWSRMD
jgi:hypothetical protein